MKNSLIYHGGGTLRKNYSAGGGGVVEVVESQKINVVHTSFQVAARENDISLYTLEAGAIMIGCRLIPVTAFGGGLIGEYYLQIGVSGKLGDILNLYRIDNVTPGNTTYAESFVFQSFNYGATTDLRIDALAVDADLDDSTQGEANVELFYLKKVE